MAQGISSTVLTSLRPRKVSFSSSAARSARKVMAVTDMTVKDTVRSTAVQNSWSPKSSR
ncbi:hypothetical protein D3C72_1936270 [compost metagenome]